MIAHMPKGLSGEPHCQLPIMLSRDEKSAEVGFSEAGASA